MGATYIDGHRWRKLVFKKLFSNPLIEEILKRVIKDKRAKFFWKTNMLLKKMMVALYGQIIL